MTHRRGKLYFQLYRIIMSTCSISFSRHTLFRSLFHLSQVSNIFFAVVTHSNLVLQLNSVGHSPHRGNNRTKRKREVVTGNKSPQQRIFTVTTVSVDSRRNSRSDQNEPKTIFAIKEVLIVIRSSPNLGKLAIVCKHLLVQLFNPYSTS